MVTAIAILAMFLDFAVKLIPHKYNPLLNCKLYFVKESFIKFFLDFSVKPLSPYFSQLMKEDGIAADFRLIYREASSFKTHKILQVVAWKFYTYSLVSGGLHGDPPISILFCTQDMARQFLLQIYRASCSYGVDGHCFILQSEDVLQSTSQVFLCPAAFHVFMLVFELLFAGCIIAAPTELTKLCSINCFPGKRN